LQSTDTVAVDEWVHIRLDVIVNLNGDVILQCFQNDLDTQAIGVSPDWQPIVGMEEIIDDTLQITTGGAPLLGGRAGFAFQSSDVTRRGFFDHIEIFKQQ